MIRAYGASNRRHGRNMMQAMGAAKMAIPAMSPSLGARDILERAHETQLVHSAQVSVPRLIGA